MVLENEVQDQSHAPNAVGLVRQPVVNYLPEGDGMLIIAPEGATRQQLCSCAVPVPQGFIFHAAGLQLRVPDGNTIPCDAHVTVHWPDGSLKWVRLQWLATDTESYQLVLDPTACPTNGSAEGRGDPACLRSTKRDARPGVQVDGVIGLLAIVLADGESLVTTLKDQRLLRGGVVSQVRTFRGECCDASGVDRLHWFATVESIPLTATQRWQVTIRNPRAARHPGGIWELGDSNSCFLRSATLSLTRSQSPAEVTSESAAAPRVHARVSLESSWRESSDRWQLSQLSSGGEHYRSAVHRDHMGSIPIAHLGYRLDDDRGQSEGSRATPALIVEGGGAGAWGISIPKFWQNFPRSLSWKEEHLELGVFPQEFGSPHELQPGEQCTVEFVVAAGTVEQVKQRLDAVATGPQTAIVSAWAAECGVIPWLTSTAAPVDSEQRIYLALIEQAIQGQDSFFAKRERIDEYGWRNFGEIYGDHEAVNSDPDNPLISHYNNQYDVVLGLGIQFLRSGDRRWLELMADLARHVIDIDIYHTDEDWPAYNHGMFWHTVHYVDAGLATHRSYPHGTCGGGPNSGHAYSRGLLLYYCLTGDETAREAVVEMGDWMIHAEDGRKSRYRWFAGGETGLTSASGTETYHGPGRGPGNAVDVLLVAFELTQERRYLEQAEHLIRRVVHPHENIAALDLLDAENKWFYLMFLQALGQYLELKISMNEIDDMYAYGQAVLLRYAQWMAEHERPFLQCPDQLEHPTETWAAQDMRKVEVFQWAARHASGAERERFLERARWFYDHATNELSEFETKHFCRPVALLLSNGHSHLFFRNGGLNGIPPTPVAPATVFPPQQQFVSQKHRAVQNVKRLAACGAIVTAASTMGLAFWWLNQ